MSDGIGAAIEAGVLVADGGVGSMLLGAAGDGPWGKLPSVDYLNRESPEAVARLHGDYVAAGADVITTNTFLCGGAGRDGVDLCRRGVAIARRMAEESGARVWVAASIGPVGGREMTARMIEASIEAGADLLLFDSIYGLRQLEDELESMELAGTWEKAAVYSATFDAEGLLGGEHDVERFGRMALDGGPVAVGVNCCSGPVHALAMAGRLRGMCRRVMVCPSAGLKPGAMMGPAEFGKLMSEAANRGEVDVAGGCCGTTPAHIAALRGGIFA